MKTGKVSESMLKRSILKQIKTKREEVVQGAGIGEDCAFFAFYEGEMTAVSTAPVITSNQEEILPLMIAAVNNIAAKGAEPVSILLNMLLPEDIFESDIQELMAQVEKGCEKLHIQLAGGHTQVTSAVIRPVFTITAIGKIAEQARLLGKYKAGQDIVLTKWIGLLGTSLLASDKKQVLLQRLPAYLIEEAIEFKRFASIVPEAATAMKSGVSGMHDVSHGGIFAALWELAEQAGVGLEIDLKKIPVKQETIEICEVLELNPYELYGAGALLIVCDHGLEIIRQLEKENISAVVIGKITDEKGKVVVNEEERRFLDRPKSDELDRVLG